MGAEAARSIHVDEAGMGLPSFDTATATFKTRLAEGTIVSLMEVDITDDTVVVVQRDIVLGAFVSLAAFLEFLLVRLSLREGCQAL